MKIVSQKVLVALSDAEEPMSSAELAEKSDLTIRQTSACLATLKRLGLVSHVGWNQHKLSRFGAEFLRKGQQVHPGLRWSGTTIHRKNTFRGRLWQAARITRKFTMKDLIDMAGRDEKRPWHNARGFITRLEKMGYLVRVKELPKSPKPNIGEKVIWALVNDTGPLHPAISERKKLIYDHNTGETFDLAKSEWVKKSA